MTEEAREPAVASCTEEQLVAMTEILEQVQDTVDRHDDIEIYVPLVSALCEFTGLTLSDLDKTRDFQFVSFDALSTFVLAVRGLLEARQDDFPEDD